MPNHRKQLTFKDEDLWYLVGLVATDGNLSSDGRHIDITAKDRNFLETIKQKLELPNKIGIKRNGTGREHHRIQISNKNLYEFLMSVGLTSNKSLSLGELKIPTERFPDFIRGVIDGDGSIRKWIHPTNKKEQWSLRIYSAAPIFINWLKDEIERNFLATGIVHVDRNLRVLKYGKLAAKRILKNCYYEGSLSLERKARLAKICSNSNIGWSTSKTLLCAN